MVKISGRRVEPFLGAPDPAIRAVLLYGPNEGLVRERAEALARRMVGDPTDPFRVSELSGARIESDPARLADEAAALSLTGGRRIVRVRDAGDDQAAILGDYLKEPKGESLIIVEAGGLGPRSSLRRLFEGARLGAALPCYGDEGLDLEEVMAETLARHKLTLDGAATDYLTTWLGRDRAQIRAEIEKLALYVGDSGESGGRIIGYEEVSACIGDSGELSLEAIGFAVGEGNLIEIERELSRAFREGVSPVSLLRASARHLQRLELARTRMAGGASRKAAMESLRPKVFFKVADAFARQLDLWSLERLAGALDLLTEAEVACKTTGAPARAVCGRALMRIAAGARAGAR